MGQILRLGASKPLTGSLIDPVHALSRSLAGCWLLGEGGGSRANDSSPAGNVVAFTANTWTGGPHGGQAVNFNGTTTFGVSSANITIGRTFTVCAWVKLGAAATAYQRILETAFGSAFYLGTNTNGSKFDFIVNSGAGLENCIGGTPTIGQWQFVCGVYDGTTSFLYVDDALVASTARTAPSASLPLYFGRASGGATQFWNGAIDGVRYYQGRDLKPSEVAQLFAEAYPGYLADDPEDFISAAPPGGFIPGWAYGATKSVGAVF